VAIIGILAAVAIPQFTKYKRNAVASKVAANLTTCVTELAAQYASNGTNTFECTLGGTDYTLTLDGNTGVVTDTDSVGNMTIDNYAISCDISDDNEIECNATAS
jgi:type IV pilus assembly protein PilA